MGVMQNLMAQVNSWGIESQMLRKLYFISRHYMNYKRIKIIIRQLILDALTRYWIRNYHLKEMFLKC